MPSPKPSPRTLQELADLAGISIASVSRALSGTAGVSQKTRERIQNLAAEHRFSPNLLARRLASGKSRRLGFIASDLVNPAYITYFHTLEKALRESDYELLIMDSENDLQLEASHLEKLRVSQVDGLLIFPVYEQGVGSPAELAAKLYQLALPTVVLGAKGVDHADHAGTDEFHGGATYGEHLLALGHEKMVFCEVNERNFPSKQRLTGLLASLEGKAQVIVHRTDQLGWQQRVIHSLLSEGATACLTASPGNLYSLYRPLSQAGIKIPGDISVGTFGDESNFGQFLDPIPAILSPDHTKIAHTAAEFLLARLKGQPGEFQSYQNKGILIPGESLAPPRPKLS